MGITKERVLYFLMGMAAVIFVSADVIAEFDRDPDTRTATSYVKQFAHKSPATFLAVLLACVWLPLHFLWEGFPL